MGGNQISKKGYDELSRQLKHLKTGKRREIAKAVNEAREQGDLRENAGYHEARKEQSLIESKIKELESRLKMAEIVEDEEKVKDIVSRGSKVKYMILDTKDVREYTIVSELEANALEKKISETTPVGSALMGAKKGDVLEVLAPMGVMKIKVMGVD
ncbi:transcription elongation factor GreA [Candidatus Saganbacteria bacterium]|nr:transcription elongation factor GreA [Candidatus Saganbacteria bacterium]